MNKTEIITLLVLVFWIYLISFVLEGSAKDIVFWSFVVVLLIVLTLGQGISFFEILNGTSKKGETIWFIIIAIIASLPTVIGMVGATIFYSFKKAKGKSKKLSASTRRKK